MTVTTYVTVTYSEWVYRQIGRAREPCEGRIRKFYSLFIIASACDVIQRYVCNYGVFLRRSSLVNHNVCI